jgi:D-alanine transaminase
LISSETKVFLNGNFVSKKDATISVFDRGFLFSDSVYEVVQVVENKLFLYSEHVARLKRSLGEVEMSDPGINWLEVFSHLIKNNPLKYGGMYIQISRGIQDKRNHFWLGSNITPTTFACLQEMSPPNPKLTLKVITLPDLRWKRCDIKSNSLLPNVMARQEAAKRQCDEALLFDENEFVNEGSSTNYFIVKDKQIITPPVEENILSGVTRNFCIDLFKEQKLNYLEQKIKKQDLFDADEIWITSSTKDVLPVSQIDEKKLNFNYEKSLFKKVSEAFQVKKNKQLIDPIPIFKV